MTSFQIVLLSFALVGAVTGIALVAKNIIGRATGAVILVLIALGAMFTVVPNWTTAIAHALGIGRGADLLLYLLVIGSSTGFLVLYVKLRAVRREVTLLVRKIALDGSTGASSDATHRKS
ncbi:MAG TPA: DUF2304 domain-containing protein [Phycisphaerales bacterium]|jgi:hypothetical protein|nr:DUF2304 domain-containing protein [Phycisphaerales bacterium]